MRAPIADGRYCPHFRVGPEGSYLGIRFIEGGELHLGEEHSATVELMYEGVDYSALRPGVTFSVCEGPNVVAVGVVRAAQAPLVYANGAV